LVHSEAKEIRGVEPRTRFRLDVEHRGLPDELLRVRAVHDDIAVLESPRLRRIFDIEVLDLGHIPAVLSQVAHSKDRATRRLAVEPR
jgi:hypothetical protein